MTESPPFIEIIRQRKTLEQAAKYVCNQQCGRCPAVLEQFTCPTDCGPETRPWRCWLSYFRHLAVKNELKQLKTPTDDSTSHKQAA
jgi:hypothetical protein